MTYVVKIRKQSESYGEATTSLYELRFRMECYSAADLNYIRTKWLADKLYAANIEHFYSAQWREGMRVDWLRQAALTTFKWSPNNECLINYLTFISLFTIFKGSSGTSTSVECRSFLGVFLCVCPMLKPTKLCHAEWIVLGRRKSYSFEYPKVQVKSHFGEFTNLALNIFLEKLS